MNQSSLFDFEISSVKWDSARELCGPATKIPDALRKLVYAETPEDANSAYWKLENHVVVQGQLFDSAIFVVDAIFAALAQGGVAVHSKIRLLELLYQILAGKTDHSERARGITGIELICKDRAMKGIWLLYLVAFEYRLSGALEIVELIDDNRARVEHLRSILNSD